MKAKDLKEAIKNISDDAPVRIYIPGQSFPCCANVAVVGLEGEPGGLFVATDISRAGHLKTPIRYLWGGPEALQGPVRRVLYHGNQFYNTTHVTTGSRRRGRPKKDAQ